jgi:hypothetical protein
MSDHIAKIARLLTEDPDKIQQSLDAYQDRWAKQSGMSPLDYNRAISILKQVAKDNGCILDENGLAPVELTPGVFSVKGIKLQCNDPADREKLKQRIADTTGDTNINYSFNKKPHTSAYLAINAEFADRLEEAGMEVSHNAHKDPTKDDHVDISLMKMPIRAKQPEEAPEDPGMEGPPPPEAPLEGPEAAPEPLGAPPPEGGMPEMPPGPEPLPDMGEFGVEPPEEGGEMPPPEEEEAMINFEQVQRIADLLTEDPDIFNF